MPHASLFNSSEAEGMDHWFSSLRSDSLLGAFAQWHDSSSEDKLTSTRQEGSPKTVTVAQMISACEPDTPVEEPDKAQNTKRQRTGKRQSANRSTSSGSASHMSSGSPEPSPTASTSTSTELHAHSSNKSNNHNKRSKGGVLSSQQKV